MRKPWRAASATKTSRTRSARISSWRPSGWSPTACLPADARAAARKAFGNVVRGEERFHESSRWVWLEQFANDLRYAARGLRQSPAFLATTVLTLAIGLSLVTVVFTIFNAYVLRPFAVRDPANLYRVAWLAPDAGGPEPSLA